MLGEIVGSGSKQRDGMMLDEVAKQATYVEPGKVAGHRWRDELDLRVDTSNKFHSFLPATSQLLAQYYNLTRQWMVVAQTHSLAAVFTSRRFSL